MKTSFQLYSQSILKSRYSLYFCFLFCVFITSFLFFHKLKTIIYPHRIPLKFSLRKFSTFCGKLVENFFIICEYYFLLPLAFPLFTSFFYVCKFFISLFTFPQTCGNLSFLCEPSCSFYLFIHSLYPHNPQFFTSFSTLFFLIYKKLIIAKKNFLG